MGRMVVSEYVTLDGYMDEPGRWSSPWFGDDTGAWKFEELKAADVMLLGRRTYEGFSAAWPTMTELGEFADKMNNMPKFVVTSATEELTWNSTPVRGDLVAEITRIKEEAGNVLVAGSGQLLPVVLDAGLVDELRLLTFPYILGNGELPIFRDAASRAFELVDVTRFEKGPIALTFHPSAG